ncbi:MAG: DPP IV N-terminal domain-containing protein [Anaerolineae bacterium]|nr:DPP IV N-terminal domain-containing protein [Anaerolineae bacterium]
MKRWAAIAIMVIFAGCTNAFQSETVAHNTDIPYGLTLTAGPSPSPSPIATPDDATPQIEEQCAQPVPYKPDASFSGKLVLQSEDNTRIYLMDLESGDINEIVPWEENQAVWFPRVSPDRTKLLYRKTTFDRSAYEELDKVILSDELLIISADGTSRGSVEWNDPIYAIDWLGEERLAITFPGSIVVVNPLTGERNKIASEWPDIYFSTVVKFSRKDWHRNALVNESPDIFVGFDPVGWENIELNGGIVLEPSLMIAIYSESFLASYVVLDLPSDEIVTKVPILSAGGHPPKWSPDFSSLIVVSSQRRNEPGILRENELYIIQRSDWQLIQLTNLRDLFDRDIIISTYNWSPQGDRVAFWMNTIRDETPAEFAAYEFQTGSTVFYCIKSDYTRDEFLPIWSPDGTQVITLLDNNEEQKSNIILIDFPRNTFSELGVEGFPVGWMK